MSCKLYQIKFEHYTEGVITLHDLEDLQRHSKQCIECGRSFEEFKQIIDDYVARKYPPRVPA